MSIIERLKSFIKNLKNKISENRKERKLKRGCIKDGRESEYDEYIDQQKRLQRDINMYEKFKSEGREGNRDRWQYDIDNRQGALKFIRPNNQKDINEREKWKKEFPIKIKELLDDSSDLRFHGTSIYNAENIIKTGFITSTVDRYNGYETSSDQSGVFSAATASTIDVVFSNGFDGTGDYAVCLPCGCTFVFKNRDDDDREKEKALQMKAINFKEHPEQLYGIVTSEENLPSVRKWMSSAGYDSALVTGFQGFIDRISQENSPVNKHLRPEDLSPLTTTDKKVIQERDKTR